MQLGRLELHVVSDGGFRLDGGSMFGAVPKVLWERQTPADERNRIRMATNCLLVVSEDGVLLIDTGIGNKNDERFTEMFGLEEGATRLPDSIRAAGYEPEDVTHVVLTHLHFDHCGWNTEMVGERLFPTFPKATYWLQQGEVAHGRFPNERDRASYDSRNWEPLFEAGVVQLFDHEATPMPGVRVVKTPGHNANHCIVFINGGDDSQAVFWADLVPTAAHVPYPWIMGFDLYPLETMENKKLWLPRAASENWVCIFEHDPDLPAGRLVKDRPGRYRAEPLTDSGDAAAGDD